ncbi:MAG: lactate utilization protein [Aigarchaeota archaeon]|nr:lactate utilization protein [Candidatus Pelearchaeum maunauluense]
MKELESIIRLFKDRFEQQAGRVYEAETLDEAASKLSNILLEQNVRRVAIAGMDEQVRERIRESLTSVGMEIVEPRGGNAHETINSAEAGVTLASFAVADIGAIAEITNDDADRLVSSLPRIHACLLQRQNIIDTFENSAQLIRDALSSSRSCVVSFIGGPSRTGDIELKLVLGVHGPHQVHVIIFG